MWRNFRVAAVVAGLVSPADALADSYQRPAVEYSAERVISSAGEVEELRINYSPDMERLESRGPEGQVQITIIRYDLGLVWFLVPEEKSYIELPLDEAELVTGLPGGTITITAVGSETIAGLACTKYRIGGEIEGDLWTTKDHNIPVRMVATGMEDGIAYSVGLEQRNIRVGPQKPALFDLPSGYKRTEMFDPALTGGTEQDLRRELLRGFE